MGGSNQSKDFEKFKEDVRTFVRENIKPYFLPIYPYLKQFPLSIPYGLIFNPPKGLHGAYVFWAEQIEEFYKLQNPEHPVRGQDKLRDIRHHPYNPANIRKQFHMQMKLE